MDGDQAEDIQSRNNGTCTPLELSWAKQRSGQWVKGTDAKAHGASNKRQLGFDQLRGQGTDAKVQRHACMHVDQDIALTECSMGMSETHNEP